jgi:hypothetical protein
MMFLPHANTVREAEFLETANSIQTAKQGASPTCFKYY